MKRNLIFYGRSVCVLFAWVSAVDGEWTKGVFWIAFASYGALLDWEIRNAS